jgi:hypothetical protein
MKREPSLHIRESDLVKVLTRLFEVEGSPVKWDCSKLAKSILKGGKKYALQHRNLLEKTAKSERQINKSTMSGGEDSQTFANLLLLCRRKAKHRGIALIKNTSRDWLIVKEATHLANQFAEEFGLTKKEAYTTYINIALSKMSKFSLIKLNSMHEAICREYECLAEISQDTHPHETEDAHNQYNMLLSEYGSLPQNWKKNPEKYSAFIKVVDICKENRIDIRAYIRAQFMGLEFAKSMPDPLQLVNDKALERWTKYAVKAIEATPAKQGRVIKIDFNKIKQDGKNRTGKP